MKRIFFAVALVVSAFVLPGCDDGHASGPGSETTNGIMATVLFENGTPAVDAAVALRKVDFISGDTSGVILVPDAYVDSQGVLELNSLEKGDYRLTVSRGEIYSAELTVSDSVLNLETIRLSKAGTVSGVLAEVGNLPKAAWIGVYGLDVLVRVDSAGRFSLNGLPPGELRLFALSESRDSVIADTGLSVFASQVSSWDWLPEIPPDSLENDTLVNDTALVDTSASDTSVVDTVFADTLVWSLYETFEDSASFAAKAWYFSADTLASISHPVDFAWNGVVKNSDRAGSVFEGHYTAPEGSYVIFGTRLSDSAEIDLSALDSIVFYAKGSGFLRLSLERWEASAEDNVKAWTSEIALSDAWTRYRVSPQDFLDAEEDSLSTGWESVKSHVNRFHFFGVGGTEFGLDDIAVYGVKF